MGFYQAFILFWVLCLIFRTGIAETVDQESESYYFLDTSKYYTSKYTTIPSRFSFTAKYTSKRSFPIYSLDTDCSSPSNPIMLPPGSRFRRPLKESNPGDNSRMLIDVYAVEKQALTDFGRAGDEVLLLNKTYQVCLTGDSAVERALYRRRGGLNTGILAVPYKLRDGEIASDSTVGPYLGYKFEVVEWVASLGVTQVSLSSLGTEAVEEKTGLTLSLGVSLEVNDGWDVFFLAGVDHLSGDAGKDWEYQDKPWLSIGIGFNFTRSTGGS